MGESRRFAMAIGAVVLSTVGFVSQLDAQSDCLDVGQELTCAPDGSGSYVLSLTVTNASSFPLEFGFHLGDPVLPVGVSFDPEVHEGIGLAPGGTTTLTTTVSGLQPGDVLCHLLALHDVTLAECCVASLCIDVPSCDGEITFVRGDCNADGGFDIADAITLLSFLFSMGPPPPCDDACDCNDDGMLDIADAISKLAALFSGSGPLPPPTVCGSDPTADSIDCVVFPPCP